MAFVKECNKLMPGLKKQLRCYPLKMLIGVIPECKTRHECEQSMFTALCNKKLHMNMLTPPLDLLYLVTNSLSTKVRARLLLEASGEMIYYLGDYYNLPHDSEMHINRLTLALTEYCSMPALNVVINYNCEQLRILCRLYGFSIDKYAVTVEHMLQHYLLGVNFVQHKCVVYVQDMPTPNICIPPEQPTYHSHSHSQSIEYKEVSSPVECATFTIQRKENRFTKISTPSS